MTVGDRLLWNVSDVIPEASQGLHGVPTHGHPSDHGLDLPVDLTPDLRGDRPLRVGHILAHLNGLTHHHRAILDHAVDLDLHHHDMVKMSRRRDLEVLPLLQLMLLDLLTILMVMIDPFLHHVSRVLTLPGQALRLPTILIGTKSSDVGHRRREGQERPSVRAGCLVVVECV